MVRSTFSPAQAWRPAVVARLARTLGLAIRNLGAPSSLTQEATLNSAQHNRVALAVEQLHVAIDLFLSNRSTASALTLAGAAEEVLGRKAERFGEKKAMTAQHEIVAKLLVRAKREVPSFKDYAKECNDARNAVKHMDPDAEEDFQADLTSEAVAKIGAACNNYERCGLPLTDKMLEFHGWYHSELGA